MNEIVTYSIVNNEMSHIKDVVAFHSSWVDAMYILDTGSTDGTLEYLKGLNNPKIIVEEYSIKYTPQYELDWTVMPNPFPEVQVRNFALKRAEELLNPKWIIQLDGDEVFLPETRNIISKNPEALCIGCSTLNPVNDPTEMPMERRGGFMLYDPHVRIWQANNNVLHMRNSAFNDREIHCIPSQENFRNHLFHHPKIKFIDDAIHFHLHWLYGRKVELFYNKMGITDRNQIIQNRPTNKFAEMLPLIFQIRRMEWALGVVD